MAIGEHISTPPLSVPGLNARIRRLASLTSSDAPVLSWYLRPDGLEWYLRCEDDVSRVRRSVPDPVAFDAAIERARPLLAAALGPSTRGAALFLRDGPEPLTEILQFKVPVSEALVFDERPWLYPLFEVRDTYDRFLVVVVRPGGTEFVEVHVGEPQPGPVWLQNGGPSGSRARDVELTVAALERSLPAGGLRFVVAGPEPLVSGLCDALPAVLRQKLVGTAVLPRHTSLPRLLEASTEAFLRWEQAKSSAAVVRLRRMLTKRLAVAGVDATLTALVRRQVDTLVLSKTFDARESAVCQTCGHVAAVGGSTRCPRCGALRAVRDEREALLALAERQGSAVELVDRHPVLQRMGHVGAILRYPSDDAGLRLAS